MDGFGQVASLVNANPFGQFLPCGQSQRSKWVSLRDSFRYTVSDGSPKPCYTVEFCCVPFHAMADAARRDRASFSRTPPELSLKLKGPPVAKPPERPVRSGSLPLKPRPPSEEKPARGKNRKTGIDQPTNVAGAPIILIDSVDKYNTIDSSPEELKEGETFMDCDVVVDSSPEHVQKVVRQRADAPVAVPGPNQVSHTPREMSPWYMSD